MAHKSYQSILPTHNKLLQKRWDQQRYETHRGKVRSASSMVDSGAPRAYPHIQMKLKKQQVDEERLAVIERDNRTLLEKMSHIMRAKGRVDATNDYGHKSLNKEKREREQLRVASENKGILTRLQSVRPLYDRTKWEDDFQSHEEHLQLITAYPLEDWPTTQRVRRRSYPVYKLTEKAVPRELPPISKQKEKQEKKEKKVLASTAPAPISKGNPKETVSKDKPKEKTKGKTTDKSAKKGEKVSEKEMTDGVKKEPAPQKKERKTSKDNTDIPRKEAEKKEEEKGEMTKEDKEKEAKEKEAKGMEANEKEAGDGEVKEERVETETVAAEAKIEENEKKEAEADKTEEKSKTDEKETKEEEKKEGQVEEKKEENEEEKEDQKPDQDESPKSETGLDATVEIIRSCISETDAGKAVGVLKGKTLQYRKSLASRYKELHDKNCATDLKAAFDGSLGNAFAAAVRTRAEVNAWALEEALQNGGETKEKKIVGVLYSLTNQEIVAVKSAYNELYESDLVEQIKSSACGHLESLLLDLCEANRQEGENMDEELAQKDARELFEAGENKLGTDESAFIKIMANRDGKQLRATFDEYEKVAEKTILASLEAEMSGSILFALQTAVLLVQDAPKYWCETMRDSLRKGPAEHTEVTRLVLTTAEDDMGALRSRYEELYGKSVADDVTENVAGELGDLLASF